MFETKILENISKKLLFPFSTNNGERNVAILPQAQPSLFQKFKTFVTEIITSDKNKALFKNLNKLLNKIIERVLTYATALENEHFKNLTIPDDDPSLMSTSLSSSFGHGIGYVPMSKTSNIKLQEIQEENTRKVAQTVSKISSANLPTNLKQTLINALAPKDALGNPSSLLGSRLIKMNSIDAEMILAEFAPFIK